MHDEMNSANFDEWGRMTANLGLEAPGATPLLQNIILYPYVNPATEILDSSDMPSSLHVTPISSAADGTQIWKITHNGVDTHPIHWHLYDVQVLNRVTWDNIIIPPDATELGWKETVRVSPLEDTIVAVRPIVPTLPFGVPDSSRPLNPALPLGARGDANSPNGTEAGFNNTDTNGNPIAPIVNVVANFELGVRLPLPHPLPRRDGHDAAGHGLRGPGASCCTRAHASRSRRGQHPDLDGRDAGQLPRPGNLDQSRDGRDRLPHRAGAGHVGGSRARSRRSAPRSPTRRPSRTPRRSRAPPYAYRVIAFNAAGNSTSNTITVAAGPAALTLSGRVTAAGTGVVGATVQVFSSATQTSHHQRRDRGQRDLQPEPDAGHLQALRPAQQRGLPQPVVRRRSDLRDRHESITLTPT